MKKWLRLCICGVMLSSATASYSANLGDVVRLLEKLNEVNTGMKLDLDQLNELLTQASQWGTWDFTDDHSWGSGATQWQDVLNLDKNHSSVGPLGQTLQDLARQFPIDTHTYNQVNPNKADQRYYELQAKTALAARAASQLSYNKIQDQIDYAKKLKDQINSTGDLKQSVDLQSRLLIENNLIQLEILRQLAVSNQQQAIQAQAISNDMAQTARFLLPK